MYFTCFEKEYSARESKPSCNHSRRTGGLPKGHGVIKAVCISCRTGSLMICPPGSFLWSGDPATLAAYKYFQFCCSCRNLFLRSGSLPVRQGHLPEIMLSCRTDSLTEIQIKKCTNHFLSPPYKRLAVHVPFYMRTATIYKRERNEF